jgi:selenocysteine lyase/cysteine desulfurase
MDCRGATLALHLLDRSGRPFDLYDVEVAAGRQGISIRTGCFCNPGAGEVANDITKEEMGLCFDDLRQSMTLRECQKAIGAATGKAPNAIRVSLGLASTFSDVWSFLMFVDSYRDYSGPLESLG